MFRNRTYGRHRRATHLTVTCSSEIRIIRIDDNANFSFIFSDTVEWEGFRGSISNIINIEETDERNATDGNVTQLDNRSVFRLRLGVVLILLWMLPFWLLGPYIASSMDSGDGEPSAARVTTIIMIVQTVIGLVGAYVAGKETARVIKGTPRKKIPKMFWRIVRHGEITGSD